MSQAKVFVSVVIPLYQDRDTIGQCLDSLLAQPCPGRLEIVVVDDGSRDGGDVIAESYPVRLVRQANAGPAAARNRGAALAAGDILVFLDSDTVAAPDFLRRVVDRFDDARTDAVLCRLSPLHRGLVPALVQSEIDERYAMVEGRDRIDFLAAAAFAIRRSVFAAIGGFDAAYLSNEDVELAFRLDAAGHVIRFAPEAGVQHAHQTRWRDIFRAKFSRGLWRMRLYARYPRKRTQDSWTPQTLKLQILLVPLILASMLVALAQPAAWWIVAAGVLAMMASGLPLLRRTTTMLLPHAGMLAPAHALVWLFGRAATLAGAVAWFKLTATPVGLRATALRRGAAILLAGAALAAPMLERAAKAATIALTLGEVEARPLSPALGFGAGVWRVPKAQRWIAPRILAAPRLATIRLALAWEVLAPATSLDDIDTRLAAYRLNEFARAAARRGATVIVTLDAMPRFMAADPSQRSLPDGPAFAKSPPRALADWSALVERVVRHFNGRLGLDPIYEVWNEPDWSYPAGFAGYVDLYGASVTGGRRADVKARFAGPALSDWLSPTTGSDLFLPAFLAEAGRRGLPVDAITIHAFYREPGRFYDLAVPRIRKWASDAGVDRAVPLIVDEWNIAATPPYPEGDLNASEAGAAFVAASLIAMDRHGLGPQAFQMIADPGQPGYSGGAFTVAGLPRPSLPVFEWAGSLSGRPVAVAPGEEWASAVGALGDDGRLRLMIALDVPSAGMMVRSAFEDVLADTPAVARLLEGSDRGAIKANLLGGGPYPAIPAAAKAGYDRAAAQVSERRAAAARLDDGAELTLALGPWSAMRVERYERIDAAAVETPAATETASRDLRERLLAGRTSALDMLAREGVSADSIKAWDEGMIAGLGLDAKPVLGLDPALAASADAAFVASYAKRLGEIAEARAEATRMPAPTLASGRITLRAGPQSVHFLVLAP